MFTGETLYYITWKILLELAASKDLNLHAARKCFYVENVNSLEISP